ncbi:MAG TPA: pitrilysin family protein [Pyrinomonadaceae bacterium]|jgi:predicted Zn-dependent peptidase|nr:pitrilysin family protein [Pyrinomonadaceae bacterium]
MRRLLQRITTIALPVVAALWAAASAAPALAQVAPASRSDDGQQRSNVSQTFKLPSTPIEQFTLPNGLRVILSEDHSVPVISVAVYYNTGSRNERPGRTGFAHLFEHMMFQGSENVPKAAHFQYVYNNGGVLNGTTSTERTNYFETMPANQLPLALWLESDRMRSLKVTQENLDNQRNAVQEEKRLNYDNKPYINGLVHLDEMIFKNPANAHSTIGSMEDLNAATVEDVREFFRIYYAPNNAVLTIVGDFDPKQARSLVEKYFATIKRQPDPPPVDVKEPAEVALRQDTFQDQFAPVPAFMLGWKLPARRTPDFYALSLASDLLVGGESSRLYQKLIKGDESVVSLQGGIEERRGPSSLTLFMIPKPGKDATQIRQTVMSEIKRLATEGPSAEEMEKLQNNLRNAAVRERQSSLTRAQRLAEFALYDNDPNLFNTEFERYMTVTAAQIKDAVARHLDTNNVAVLDIVPARSARPATAAASVQPPVEQEQAAQPPPQVPPRPPAQPSTSAKEIAASPTVAVAPVGQRPEQTQEADPAKPAGAVADGGRP